MSVHNNTMCLVCRSEYLDNLLKCAECHRTCSVRWCIPQCNALQLPSPLWWMNCNRLKHCFFPLILPVGIFKKSLRIINHEANNQLRGETQHRVWKSDKDTRLNGFNERKNYNPIKHWELHNQIKNYGEI